jgi:uncharacterized protein (TIGR00297 family)
MPRLLTALIVTLLFAAVGWAVGGVTLSGAAAGLVVAFALYYGIGSGAFGVLVTVFAITWIATHVGYARKQRLGVAESRRGRRNAGQVLANLGIAGICAAVAHIGRADWATVGAMAALAEAAADTASSECGKAWSNTAYRITDFHLVPPGTDGAVSAVGTLAGVAAAALVAVAATALQVVSWRAAIVIALAGIIGAAADSFLGATAERRGWMNNNAVNFVGTLFAALIAILASR